VISRSSGRLMIGLVNVALWLGRKYFRTQETAQ
jgi:hypothetical protein